MQFLVFQSQFSKNILFSETDKNRVTKSNKIVYRIFNEVVFRVTGCVTAGLTAWLGACLLFSLNGY